MGDAGGKMRGAIILDGYSRAYALDLAATIGRAPQERPLGAALNARDYRTVGAALGGTSMSITTKRNELGRLQVGLAQTGLGYEDSRKAKAVAGYVLSRLTPETAVAFGISESGRALQQRLAGHAENAFLVARDPLTRSGFHADSGTSFGIRQELGPVAITVTSEQGEVIRSGRRLGQPDYSIASVMADRRVGPGRVTLGLSRLSEEETVLGGHFSTIFTPRGARTYFADATASFDLGDGWDAFASYRRGWTAIPSSSAFVTDAHLHSEAFAFDISKSGAFTAGDRLSFRMMQPLRVAKGGFGLTLPVSYDYSTRQAGYANEFFNLAPSGREIDYEAAYSVGALGGALDLNTFLRTDPGHIEAAPRDVGAAIRFTLGL